MTSLRVRLVAWYVSVGAFIVVCTGALAAMATIESASYEARQAMASAARQIPGVMAEYRAHHSDRDPVAVDQYMQQRFRSLGVIVRAVPAPPMAPQGRADVFQARPYPAAHDLQASALTTDHRGPALFPRPPNRMFVSVQMDPLRAASMFERLLAMAIKPITAGYPGGQALIMVDPHSLQGIFSRLAIFVLILAVVVLTAAWRIAVTVAGNTLEPLLRTTDALNRFGSGDFTPAPVRTDDRTELGELAHAYNRAVAQITRAFDERSKTEAEMRQFVGDAGHQLRTPLTVIMGHLSAMVHRAKSPQQAEALETMLAQSRRMKALIDDLITLARLEHPNHSSTQLVDVNELCERLSSHFGEAARKRVNVRTAAVPAMVTANENDLEGAVCVLVDNALKYAREGCVEVSVSADNAHWIISVADRGPGMTGEDLRSAYDRFYRGSAADGIEGTGLGLPIARKSIERAGGTLFLCNRSGGGLLCTIRLNAARGPYVSVSAAR